MTGFGGITRKPNQSARLCRVGVLHRWFDKHSCIVQVFESPAAAVRYRRQLATERHLDYIYMAERFASARSCLMLPHPNGIAESVSRAMFECMLAWNGLKDQASKELEPYLSRLTDLMDTSGLVDPHGIGLHVVKARMFTGDDLEQFSRTVDELARLCARDRDVVLVPQMKR